MREAEVEDKMTRALKIAKQCWKNADMPLIRVTDPAETAKIGLAILAAKIFDKLD